MSDKDLLALLAQTHSIHRTEHGPDCGIVRGPAKADDPCALLEQAWSRTFPKESRAEKGRRYRASHRDELNRRKRARRSIGLSS